MPLVVMIRGICFWEEAASMRYVKLRLTGFECQDSFVIRCAEATLARCGPPLYNLSGVSVFLNNLMSLPINVDTTSI